MRGLASIPAPEPDRIENNPETIGIGDWFWVNSTHHVTGEATRWLACVTRVGSNYVELTSPSRAVVRVLLAEVVGHLTPEPDFRAVIDDNIKGARSEVQRLLKEVHDLTARLGIQRAPELDMAATGGTALAVSSGSGDAQSYKLALVQAKDKDLPELFEAIKEANEVLATWMGAELLPFKAVAEGAKSCIATIEDRIFNVSLYAGLTEEAVCVRKGKAAPFEPLRLMQRRVYMDEECLAAYTVGGIHFNTIEKFDRWLGQPENLGRILPFPRCMVAMRVRRAERELDWDGSFQGALINIQLAELDRRTFLYIRNGQRLYRINCDLEFGELLFPDRDASAPDGPMVAKMFCDRVDATMPLDEYESRCEEYRAQEAKWALWREQNPEKKWLKAHPEATFWDWEKKAGLDRSYGSFRPEDWRPFDKTNTHYDEIRKTITDQVKYHNRIATIIQGIYDRSTILHPHPPVRVWTSGGFESAIALVYDHDRVMHGGAAPDFEAYRARCNASLGLDSVVYGQDLVWAAAEATKENERTARYYQRSGRDTHYERKSYRPYGNRGPGVLARMFKWHPRRRAATFTWFRRRERRSWDNKPIACSITVPSSQLFNVSAYRPGDFRQFYADPRTRAAYLKWAPMLLTAEEYHAGNGKVQRPGMETPDNE